MKFHLKYITIALLTLIFSSCEDVVDIDLTTGSPKLVIDAAIKWQKGTSGSTQKIKLTTTTGFYSTSIPVVSGAIVSISDSDNQVFDFIEVPNTGEYICTNFIPVINKKYTLNVNSNGEHYEASTILFATPEITRVEQKTVPGFGNEEQIQVKFFYQDSAVETNYYLVSFKNSTKVSPEYSALDDVFFQGNEMFGFYTDADLKKGILLDLSVEGISSQYFNYMSKLIAISGSSGGRPFATAPATLRGNIINKTDTENYPLGYFSLSEIDRKQYIVE
jgi:hypothetical protein